LGFLGSLPFPPGSPGERTNKGGGVLDQRVKEIMARIPSVQRRYVVARLTCDSSAAACRQIGISKSTPCHWDNMDELEEAIGLLYNDVIEAAKLALENLAIEAARALGKALKDGGGTSVAAAKAILDRIGLPAMSQVDMTSGGQVLPTPTITEVVVKLPADEGVEDG